MLKFYRKRECIGLAVYFLFFSFIVNTSNGYQGMSRYVSDFTYLMHVCGLYTDVKCMTCVTFMERIWLYRD